MAMGAGSGGFMGLGCGFKFFPVFYRLLRIFFRFFSGFFRFFSGFLPVFFRLILVAQILVFVYCQ